MADNPVVEWITDTNTCFLFGAGCSQCAGKPLISELSKRVLTKLSKPLSDLFDSLEAPDRPVSFEDLLNYLIRLRLILESRKQKSDEHWNIESVGKAIESVTRAVVEEIGGDWVASDVHARFFRRLQDQASRSSRDIFLLNYDVVTEATLESLRLAYTDGFRGAQNAHFDPAVFDVVETGVLFRLYKLHGSINWIRDSDEMVRRRQYRKEDPPDVRVVIYPCEQKYLLTQYGVYETLLAKFRERLKERRQNNTLVILGYSFSDDHVNEAIMDAIRAPDTDITVHALVGSEGNEQQVGRFERLVAESNNRLNVMIGKDAFLGSALTTEEWDGVKDLELWKFENLVSAIAGN